MAAPASELGWVFHFAPVVRFTPLSPKQFYILPENFKSVPTMTFDLWPDFQGHVKRNLRSVPFQRLKLANFGMFAGDMDMDLIIILCLCFVLFCEPWKINVYVGMYFGYVFGGDIHGLHWHYDLSEVNWGHQRSMTFGDVICHFSGFCVPRVFWCADFEFGIRLPFICVEIGSLEP